MIFARGGPWECGVAEEGGGIEGVGVCENDGVLRPGEALGSRDLREEPLAVLEPGLMRPRGLVISLMDGGRFGWGVEKLDGCGADEGCGCGVGAEGIGFL